MFLKYAFKDAFKIIFLSHFFNVFEGLDGPRLRGKIKVARTKKIYRNQVLGQINIF